MKKFLKKSISLILSAVIALSPVFAVQNTLSSFQYGINIAEKTQYIKTADWSSGKINQSNYFLYSPNEAVVPVVAYGNRLYGRSTLNEIAAYLENSGYNVIGGINADFFTLANGLPCGIVIIDGKLISSDGWQYAVGFNSDGTAFIDKPLLKISAYTEDKWLTISAVNKLRTDSGVYLLTEDFSSNTQIKSDGTNIVIKLDYDQKLTVGGSVYGTVQSVEKQSASTAIPQGCAVLTASAAMENSLSGINAGERITITVKSDDPRWAQARYAVGGGALLLNNGNIVSNTDKSVNPRSAVGIKADGSIILYTVDGRQKEYSTGMSYAELSQELKNLGCVSALNLDGGGSTTFGIKYPGEFPISVINRPSDGAQRKCANFIFLVSKPDSSYYPAHIHLYPESYLTLRGAEISFDLKATDNSWTPVEISGTPVLTADASLGTIGENNILKVSDDSRGGTVYASFDGMNTTAYISVVSGIDDISIQRNGKNVKNITLDEGESIDLNASASLKGNAVCSADRLFIWSVSNEAAGSIDKDGVFTAGNSGTFATVTASYGGASAAVQITVGKTPFAVTEFENEDEFSCRFIPNENADEINASEENVTEENTRNDEISPILLDEEQQNEENIDNESEDVTQPDANVSVNKDARFVKYGFGSLKVKYAMNGITEILPKKALSLSGAKNVDMWIYGDNSGNKIQACALRENGETIVSTPVLIDFEGWKKVAFEFDDKISSISKLEIISDNIGGTLYFDTMTAYFGAVCDDGEPPTVTFDTSEEIHLEQGEKFTLSGTVSNGLGSYIASENVTATVDGTALSVSYNRESGRFSVAANTSDMSAGIHRFTISAKDSAGNISRLSRDFTVGEKNQYSFSDTAQHWAKDYIDFLADKGIINGSAAVETFVFKPSVNATRAEMAAIMARYLKLDTEKTLDTELPFDDAEQIPNWAVPYVKAVYANGIMQGKQVGDKVLFDPMASVTRAECMTMLGRTIPMGYAEPDNQFTDNAQIASWAKPYINTLLTAGIINGYADGAIKPLNNITRGEIAAVLYKMY